jgi:hypothetical protein
MNFSMAIGLISSGREMQRVRWDNSARRLRLDEHGTLVEQTGGGPTLAPRLNLEDLTSGDWELCR